MLFTEGIKLALQQIRAQKLKSFFAVIGVVIGVMFLMTVVTVIEGMNRYMEEDFAAGSTAEHDHVSRWRSPDQYLRRAMAGVGQRPGSRSDADAIREQLDVPALVAVEAAAARVAAEDGTEIENVWLTTASADYFRIRELKIARGRAFTAPEDRIGAPVVILGHEAAQTVRRPDRSAASSRSPATGSG